MGEMRVMGRKGDTKISWNPDNRTEVDEARKAFNAYKDKGFAAFKVSKRGAKGEQVRDFCPDAEEILFVPPIQGG